MGFTPIKEKPPGGVASPLEDGTQLWLADGTTPDNVKEGQKVKVSYEEKDGKNWATSFEVVPE